MLPRLTEMDKEAKLISQSVSLKNTIEVENALGAKNSARGNAD